MSTAGSYAVDKLTCSDVRELKYLSQNAELLVVVLGKEF